MKSNRSLPKVSVIIPIYGVEQYIERCVRSLFEQTYSNIEYVFVDDCSQDRSVDILMSVLSEYSSRKEQVKLIRHSQNRGLSAARNTGVANMTGDYLWHVDSDDYIANNAVELLVREMQQTEADVVIFSHNNVYEHRIKYCRLQPFDKHEYIQRLLLNSIPASMWNKFYKSSFYQQSGIQSIEGVNQGEDYVVVPRILYYASKITWLDKPLYFYNLTNQSSFSNNISLASIKSQKRADDVLYEFFKDECHYKDVIDRLYIRSMLFLVKVGRAAQYDDIIREYRSALDCAPPYLSLFDNLILFLINKHWFNLCAFMIAIRKII